MAGGGDNQLLKPSNPSKSGAVLVSVSILANPPRLTARYYKDEDFIGILKKHHLRWDSNAGLWWRQVPPLSGDAFDRAAELCADLLANGFVVECNSKEIIARVTNAGTIKQECRRWIAPSRIAGYLNIIFDRDDALFSKAIGLPGAHWDRNRGCISIGTSHAAEVRDFARLFQFGITEKAEAMMKEYEMLLVSAPVVSVKPLDKKGVGDPVRAILKSSAEILPDLRDE